jgi:microcystin-dependent protein
MIRDTVAALCVFLTAKVELSVYSGCIWGWHMADYFVGQIGLFSFDFAPKNWAECDGRVMGIAQNQALFSLIGTTYGGDGVTTFALPDLRGRAPIGFGTSAQSGPVALGQVGGSETVTLTGPNLPSHTHALTASTQVATRRIPSGRALATDTSTNAEYYAPPGQVTPLSPGAIGPTGGNGSHENRQPYLPVNYCMALFGLYPSRN